MDTKRVVFGAMMALGLAGSALAQGGMGMMGSGDAKVTKEQFLQHAEERFARMDANKDGVIDASDRQQMRQRMRECREMMGDMGMMGGHRMRDQGDTQNAPPPKP